MTGVYFCRLGEMEEQLDNKDKEYREMKMRTDERIRVLEKKLVLVSVKDKIKTELYYGFKGTSCIGLQGRFICWYRLIYTLIRRRIDINSSLN